MDYKRKFYTVAQLTEYFGDEVISKGAVYSMIKKGEIPSVQLGERILIPAQWVEDFMENANQLVFASKK